MLTLNWLSFPELSIMQLYDILKLRSEIFVVEQQCAFLDIDGLDMNAIHLLATENDKLVAYLRIYQYQTLINTKLTNNGIRFGRVITANHVRGKGYGKLLMTELLNYCNTHYPQHELNCSAQYRLKKFYESFGFIEQGDIYLEDDVDHIAMVLQR
jgi:ElaA protein